MVTQAAPTMSHQVNHFETAAPPVSRKGRALERSWEAAMPKHITSQTNLSAYFSTLTNI